MRKTFIILILFIAGISSARSQTWQELYDKTTGYMDKQDFSNAAATGEKALRQAEKEFGKNDTNYAASARQLSMIYFFLHELPKALEYGKIDSVISKQLNGPESQKYAEAIKNMGILYFEMYRLEEAEPVFYESLRIMKKIYGDNNSILAPYYNNLVKLNQRADRLEDAIPFINEAIRLYKTNEGVENPLYARSMFILGQVYYKMCKYDEAERALLEAMNIFELKVGRVDRFYASGAAYLAFVYEESGRYREALELLREADATFKEKIGTDHPFVATTVQHLGLVLCKLGKYDEAKKYLDEALEIRKNKFGENNALYIESLNDIGKYYIYIKDFSKAEQTFNKSLKLSKDKNEASYSESLMLLANLHFDRKDFPGAEQFINQAMEIRKNAKGSDDPVYAAYLYSLALCRLHMDNAGSAKQLITDAYSIMKNTLGENSPEYAKLKMYISDLNDKLNNYDENESRYSESVYSDLKKISISFPGLSINEKDLLKTALRTNFESYDSFDIDNLTGNKEFLSEMLATDINPKAAKIDEIMKLYNYYGTFNGTVIIAEHGKEIFKKGYGYANFEWSIPNRPDTKFNIGSDTKQFTAMMILQLVEEGKISLDGKISDYLPDYRKDIANKVTIHQLLTHTSGIPSYTSLPGFMTDSIRNPYEIDYMVKHFCSGDLEFEPGSSFKYNNSGYFLLGAIIEKVSGKPVENVLREKILMPLKMNNTGYYKPADIIENRAGGYEKDGKKGLKQAAFVNWPGGYTAAGMYSTAEDLYIWEQALYTEKLVSKKYLDLMFKKHVAAFGRHYGYAWFLTREPLGDKGDSIDIISHKGGIFGFNVLIVRLVKDKNTIILCHNLGEADLNDVKNKIIAILYDKEYKMPQKPLRPIGEVMVRAVAMLKQSAAEAMELYDKVKKETPDDFDFSVSQLNMAGYKMIAMNKIDDAIYFFKANAEKFPDEAQVYYSLAEAYKLKGDKEKAAMNLKKCLKLEPDNAKAKKMLEEIE